MKKRKKLKSFLKTGDIKSANKMKYYYDPKSGTMTELKMPCIIDTESGILPLIAERGGG
jgi:hypothetical protein